jgi:hypothetical protein
MPPIDLIISLAIGFPIIVFGWYLGDRIGKRRKNNGVEKLVERGVEEQRLRNMMISKKPRDPD